MRFYKEQNSTEDAADSDEFIHRMVDPLDDVIDEIIDQDRAGAVTGLLVALFGPEIDEDCFCDEEISLFVRGELPAPDSFLVNHHIKTCADCFEAVSRARAQKSS